MYGDANLHLLNKTNPNFKSRVKEALFYIIIQAWHGPGFDPNLGATPVQTGSSQRIFAQIKQNRAVVDQKLRHAKCSKCGNSILLSSIYFCNNLPHLSVRNSIIISKRYYRHVLMNVLKFWSWACPQGKDGPIVVLHRELSSGRLSYKDVSSARICPRHVLKDCPTMWCEGVSSPEQHVSSPETKWTENLAIWHYLSLQEKN